MRWSGSPRRPASGRPRADEAAFLGLTGDQRVISIRRVAFDESGRAVEVCDAALHPDRWVLEDGFTA
jgi:DNA-binding GntR family transcriptional regulator